MAGDRQAPSGTPFDPLPQLYVHEWTLTDGLLTILGTCFFGIIAVGSTFDRWVHRTETGWEEVAACDLEIMDISIFDGVLVDTLDENYNARLTVKGGIPTQMDGPDHLLIGTAQPEGTTWEWDGRLWVLSGATP